MLLLTLASGSDKSIMQGADCHAITSRDCQVCLARFNRKKPSIVAQPRVHLSTITLSYYDPYY